MSQNKKAKNVYFDARNCSVKSNYTQIPNTLIRDNNLSYKARGILILLLSHKDGWTSYMETLCSDFSNPDGRTSIESGIKELEKFGYFDRKIFRNKESKQIVGSFIAYTDTPFNFDFGAHKEYADGNGLEIADHPQKKIQGPAKDSPAEEKPATENQQLRILIDKNINLEENQFDKIVSLETTTGDESPDESTSEFPVPTVGSNETQSVESIPTRTPKGTPKKKPVESDPPQPKQIQRTLKQKPIAPKPLPKIPKHIVELIDYWNSFKIVQHKLPNTHTYKEAVKMLKKLLNGTFFDKNGKFDEYSGRVFTEQEIKTSISNFALAAKNYNYMPLNGYKKALQKTGLPSFLHNSYGSEERSYLLEYLDKKPELAKVSGYLMDDEDFEMTLQIKKNYLRITKKEKINSIEDIQRIKFDTVEENKFRLATKKLNAFYKDNKKKFSSWCAGELYSGTMAAKGKRAQYFLEFIFKNKNEEVSKICPGNLCSDYSLDNFAKWCNDQALFEG